MYTIRYYNSILRITTTWELYLTRSYLGQPYKIFKGRMYKKNWTFEVYCALKLECRQTNSYKSVPQYN